MDDLERPPNWTPFGLLGKEICLKFRDLRQQPPATANITRPKLRASPTNKGNSRSFLRNTLKGVVSQLVAGGFYQLYSTL